MPEQNLVDMRVTLAGMEMANPIVAASGTFGFGREYAKFYPLKNLGGVCAKGLTMHRREGNPGLGLQRLPPGFSTAWACKTPVWKAF